MAFVSSLHLCTSTSQSTAIDVHNNSLSYRRPRSVLKRTSFIGTLKNQTKLQTIRPHTVSMALGKVVVAGGTGFVGTRLVRQLISEGSAVTILSRSEGASSTQPLEVTVRKWSPSSDSESSLFDTLENADLVVNLAGAPVVSRWSEEGKAEILSSRVDSTFLIARAIAAMPEDSRPKCVVCASAVGYYGSWPYLRGAPEVDEANEAGGNADFLVDVCRKWEDAAKVAQDKTRWVTLRLGVVVAPGGGAMLRMLPVFQAGLGGPVGNGLQAISFIHADDLVNMILTAGKDSSVTGIYNGTAPSPTTMAEMSNELAKALGRPCLFPVPGFVLKLLYGDGAQVVLEGQRVIPTKWLARGFKFKYPTIDTAMKAVAEEASK